jgi:tRNA1(Val) A37 N6-methylase TrmN6
VFLYQPVEGYRYNSDSIFLYDFISTLKPKGRLLDIGCGVGIISLLLSRDYNLDTTIIDKQESMLTYAKHNFEINGLDTEVLLGDIAVFENEEKFDFIVSNPPFYDSSVTQSENEHINIARYSHHMPIEVLISAVKRLLKPRGYFVFCYDAKQVDIVLQRLKEAKINPEILRFVHPKADREAKIVLIAARDSSKSMTKVMAPLIVFDSSSQYLEDANRAFEKAGTHSIKASRLT